MEISFCGAYWLVWGSRTREVYYNCLMADLSIGMSFSVMTSEERWKFNTIGRNAESKQDVQCKTSILFGILERGVKPGSKE